MCENFQDFQRWQNDIVDNTERHNSVDNGLYHGVHPMEDNALHPDSRTRAKRHGDFTRKTLNTHKPCYTRIQAKDNEIHSHCCLIKCHTLVSDEAKTKRRIRFQTNSHGAKRGKCSHGCVCREPFPSDRTLPAIVESGMKCVVSVAVVSDYQWYVNQAYINTSSFAFCHQLQGLITAIYGIVSRDSTPHPWPSGVSRETRG
jgi:hypothetical protein